MKRAAIPVLFVLLTAPGALPAQGASGDQQFGLDTAFFKGDQPIEISADQLDVDQNAQVAVFGGNVNAVQGEIVMRSDVLTVYYEDFKAAGASPPADGPPAETGDAGGAGAGVGTGKIRRMEVSGGVYVSSPTETASGDEGVYDVAGGTITLIGNVVLTRGQNVLRGARLSIDVASGKSVIQGASTSGGRVKGLFLPSGASGGQAGGAAQETAPAP